MNGLTRALCASALFAFASVGTGWADPVLPLAAKPEDVGLSSSQLARIEAVTQKHIESGTVPGAVILWHGAEKSAGTRPWASAIGPPRIRCGPIRSSASIP